MPVARGAVAGGMAAVALVAWPVPATAAASNARRVGAAPHRVAGSRIVGALGASTAVKVTVTLKPRHPAALAAYASAVSTPGSGVYRRFLTVGQFSHRFGASPAQIAAVKASLAAHGLRSGAVTANGLAIRLHATAGRIAHAFSIGFDRVLLPGGRVAFANTSAPRFDGAVAGVVQGVLGLNTLQQRRPMGLAVAHGRAHAAPAVVTGGPQPCPAASGVGEYTADQIASAYRFSSLYGAGDQGAGQAVAIYELESNSTSDIAAYQSCYGTSAPVTYSKVDSGSGTGAGTGEAALDIEDVIGLAPKSSLIVYQGPNTNAGAYDTFNAIINQDTAKVISTSWGLCEPQEGSSAAAAESALFQEAATQGQSIFAASGDDGSEDCGNGNSALAVDDPGTQPFVTSVGGTSMSALGPPPTQSVWNNSIGAGGGGNSTLWPMPTYQSTAPPSLKVINGSSTNTTCHVASGSFCREVPDVSADADPNTGYAIDYKGHWIGIGGTSAAAPTWASFAVLVNASSFCGGRPIGFANPALYGAAASSYASNFSDVTSGNNDFTHTNGGRFAAGTGFDLATGLGTPIGPTLAGVLCSATTVSVTNPGNQAATVGMPITLAIKASASNGRALTYSAAGLPAGLSINSTSGLISGTPTTAATSSVTVTAIDASGRSGTTTFTWTISLPVSGGCTAAQLLGNPGFETGSASPWSSSAGVINSTAAGEPAHTGAYVAWLDGYGRAHTDTLAQTVSIPAGCSSYAFSFWLHIDTTEPTTNAADTLTVQVLSGAGAGSVQTPLASFSNRNAAGGYVQHAYSLAGYAGQTVTLTFTGTENASRQTSFVIDDTALNVS
jgi:subtilase family serine protease